jgi:hypothetical protein
VTGATAAGSLAYAQKGVTGTSFAKRPKRNKTRETNRRLSCPLYFFFLLTLSFFLSLSQLSPRTMMCETPRAILTRDFLLFSFTNNE